MWALLPQALTELLAGHEADRLADEIARQLDHRTVAELGDRIARHWAYWRWKVAADLVRQPVAIAFRVVRRDFDCPDVRCEDRWHLDLDTPCKACVHIGETIVTGRRADAHHSAPPNPSDDPQHRPSTPTPPPVSGRVSARHTDAHAEAAARGAALARQLLYDVQDGGGGGRYAARAEGSAVPTEPEDEAPAAIEPPGLSDAEATALRQATANARTATAPPPVDEVLGRRATG